MLLAWSVGYLRRRNEDSGRPCEHKDDEDTTGAVNKALLIWQVSYAFPNPILSLCSPLPNEEKLELLEFYLLFLDCLEILQAFFISALSNLRTCLSPTFTLGVTLMLLVK